MVKKKEIESQGAPQRKRAGGDDESSEDDDDMLNIEFEWFDPQETDFHGLKVLLRQLLDADSELFDLSALSNLILSQPLLGSTVKTAEDGMQTNETDPFAFLTVLNLHAHRDNPAVRSLASYLLAKSASTPLSAPLAPLLSTPDPAAQVGLILTERFINMPHEVTPPMYKMLLEEIRWAVDEGEPYAFSHFLILSKTYTELGAGSSAATEDGAGAPSKKRAKTAAGGEGRGAGGEVFYFHPEDEVLARHSVAAGEFEYTRQDGGGGEAKRAFQEAGIRPRGRLMLLEAGKLEAAVKDVEEYLSSGQILAGT